VSEAAGGGPERRRRRKRGRRGRRGGGRGFTALLPHLFTTGNLAAGFYAIVKSSEGQFERACLALIFAALFDFLDGRVARMTHATSRFGVEYDSIADTVSFGVAPAMLAFSAGNLAVLGRPGWVMVFLYTVCAALRLARFNVSPGRYRGRFEGMPSPAAAGCVASTQWFVSFLRDNGVSFEVPEFAVAGGVALLGLLMVSPIPYRSGKELDLRHSFGTLVMVVIALALIVQEPSVTLFVIGVVYALSGPFDWMVRKATGAELEELPASSLPDSPRTEP